MPTMRLSEKSIERLRYAGKDEVVWDARLRGFGVRLAVRGHVYCIYTRVDGKQLKHTIGRADRWTFDEAYAEAERVLRDAARGITPADRERERVEAEAMAARAAQSRKAEEYTVEELLDRYCGDRNELKEGTATQYKSRARRYLAGWMPLRMLDITHDMVAAKHKEIGAISVSQANSVFRVLRAMFNYAQVMYPQTFTVNPVQRLTATKGWYKVTPRKRHVKPTQLPLFFDCVRTHPGIPADYIELLLLTGMRSASEMARLQIQHVDFAERIVELFDTKTRDYLAVPVSGLALEVLRRRVADATAKGTTYLFYAYQPQPAKRGEFLPSFPARPLTDIGDGIRALFVDTALSGHTPHDMRRSFLNYAEEVEVPNLVQKRLVGHAISQDVTDGYKLLSMERLRKAVRKIELYIQRHAKV